jgi:hypothetical protein
MAVVDGRTSERGLAGLPTSDNRPDIFVVPIVHRDKSVEQLPHCPVTAVDDVTVDVLPT